MSAQPLRTNTAALDLLLAWMEMVRDGRALTLAGNAVDLPATTSGTYPNEHAPTSPSGSSTGVSGHTATSRQPWSNGKAPHPVRSVVLMRHQRLLQQFQVCGAGKGVAIHDVPCAHSRDCNFTRRKKGERARYTRPKTVSFPAQKRSGGPVSRSQVFWTTGPLLPSAECPPGLVSVQQHLADFVGSRSGLGAGRASALAELQMHVAGLQLARRV